MKPLKVEREAYSGPVVKIPAENGDVPSSKPAQNPNTGNSSGEFHNHRQTRSGVRNMQDSSFSLSGKMMVVIYFCILESLIRF